MRGVGYELKVVPLTLPEVEVGVYGATGDLCAVGEARVGASPRVIDELNEKVELLKRHTPDKLRPARAVARLATAPSPEGRVEGPA